MLVRLFTSLVCITLLSACAKDRLTGAYDEIEGEYKWVYTEYVKTEYLIFSVKYSLVHHDAQNSAYSAGVRFTDKGRIQLLIDDAEFIDRPFKVLEKEEEEGGRKSLILKVDVNRKDLDINDKLNIVHFGSDTLIVREFPGSAYDQNIVGDNYFIRVK